MLFVFRGEAKDGEDYFQHFWPGVHAIADPTGDLFRFFGLFRASWSQLLGPRAMLAGWRAYRKGYRNGTPGNDTLGSPGLFIIENETIVWEHNFHHVGDHPDFCSLS